MELFFNTYSKIKPPPKPIISITICNKVFNTQDVFQPRISSG